MIEKHNFLVPHFQIEANKEIQLFSIIAQSFFQPLPLVDNLLVILTALTAGSGVGFNRAMLFFAEGDELKGEMWLGPRSAEEANSIWQVLSTPGIGYAEIIKHNRFLLDRNADTLSNRVKGLSYSLSQKNLLIPALPAGKREIMVVRDARNESLVDKSFLDIIGIDEFLCIPLLSPDEILGEIVLDNAITRASFQARDIELASICAIIAGNYIYVAHLQKKMAEMQKLAAMGEMAMFITHQLRNPLVTIGGFTDQLLSSRISSEKRKRNLLIIKNEIERLEKILSRLTLFHKIEIKEPVGFDVQEIINFVLASSETRIKSRGIKMKVRLEEGLPDILGDPVYVGEALRNVLDNALDATPDGGDIFIQCYRENKEWVVISIKDTGKGIPESIKNKIFLSFFSTKEMGMGLGLSYVKRVMDACGGKIEVESEEGKGTLFRLYFKMSERG
jgi:hypothetical protein